MLGAGLVHNENQLSSDIATLKDPATPVRTRGPWVSATLCPVPLARR